MTAKWVMVGPDREMLQRELKIEVRKQKDGTWMVLVWKSPASSAPCGTYHDVGVAKYAAENMPLDPASIEAMTVQPFGFGGTSFTAER